MSTSSNNGRFRTFGDTFGKGSPVFLHIADTGTVFPDADGNLTTGAWRPATPSDIGSVANLSVSGLSLTVGAVAVTGNPLMTVSNASPIPISGWVSLIGTGVTTTNIPNPLAVTGTQIDRNTSISGTSLIPYSMLPVGGRAVASNGPGSITGGYSIGDYVMFSFDKDNGGLMVNQGILDRTQDNITVWNAGSGVSSNDTVTGTFGVVLSNNPNRRQWFIQNLHTGCLMVRFSNIMPTTSNMNILLKGGAAINDGNGASYSDDGGRYRGPVSVTGFGGAPVLINIWEI